ncbi:hypothetical protein OB2597_08834 [Pseudooceanicola batsensis HTCC2597]|uniref:Uncharacterized protein n=1 Tax=Pseudooceanicola batsensis (strain ATCC BAA-863 / DSM 15984 / KCTC 12145 / HTCC2597) TaxID=252305 RepID=A3TUN9_PSEBH|nr:hypothetical protein [Pseudooceanicola batsensis]EAQ04235.1 hypothetical protein OB2597_08834 [Pseudooceanicola batsensis HTCC2597]
MADSVTNVQIEDVLSSIRKLVSEEVRAQSRETANQPRRPDRPAAPAADDRLILTPSLRVTPQTAAEETGDDEGEAGFIHAESDDAPEREADLLNLMERVRAAGDRHSRIEANRPTGIAPVRDPATEARDAGSPDIAIEAALAALGVARDADPDAPEADAPDPTLLPASEAAEPDALTGEAESDEREASVAPAEEELDEGIAVSRGAIPTPPETGEDVVPTFLRHRGVTSLGQRVAEVEAVVSTSGGEWEPEADEISDAAPQRLDPAPAWDDEDEDEAQADALAAETWQTDPTALSADEAWAVDPIDDADIAAMADASLRAVTPLAAVKPERDIEDRDAGVEDAETADADAARDVASVAEAEDRDPPEDDFDDAAFDEAGRNALTAEDTAVLDEEMLRDLVAEIVRQELQGALGERITRNVRKLVRREIHRALSAQDFS